MTVEEARQLLAGGNAPPATLSEARRIWNEFYSQQESVIRGQEPAYGTPSPPATPGAVPTIAYPGYNPQQYATQEAAEQLAAYLGGRAVLSEPAGPIAPPPAWMIRIGGEELNAGLLAARYATYPRDFADRMTQDELVQGGVSWQAPATQPPFSATGSPAAPTTAQAGGSSPTAHPSTVAETSGSEPGYQPAGSAATVQAQIREALAAQGITDGTPDQWGWAYQLVTGQPAPPPEDLGFVGDRRFAPVSFDIWWAALQGGARAAEGGVPQPSPAVVEWWEGLKRQGLVWLIRALLEGGAVWRT